MKTRTNLKSWLAVWVLMLAVGGGSATGTVIYVNTDASGANNGESWTDAFNFLQDALAVATSGDEILVAQGIYKPDEDTDNPDGSGDRAATFHLENGVAINGGFGGETILSGEIGTGSTSNNSYHVVTASGCGDGTILDGFVITGGNASPESNRQGGGMYVEDSRLTVRNCAFSENTASQGGGMYNRDSAPDITDCTFISNTVSRNGGGVYNINSAPKIRNCLFQDNQATDNGGGINTVTNSASDITNCTFLDNTAGGGGGGLHVTDSSPKLVNCSFICNSAEYGGGMHTGVNSTPALMNCVFVGNSADMDAGAMNNNESDATVTNCTFYDNSAPRVGGILNINGYPTVTNCILWGNTDEQHSSHELQQIDGHPGMTINYCCIQGWTGDLDPDGDGNIGDDPMFVGGGNCRLLAGSPCIDAGDSDAPDLSNPDIDGNPRIVGLAVDMGAYEFQDPLQHTAAANTIQLVDEVEALDLPAGIENSLVSKLENTIDSIQKGQTKAAVNKLEAFVNEVEAQQGNKIPQGDADDLIEAAQAIIDDLLL